MLRKSFPLLLLMLFFGITTSQTQGKSLKIVASFSILQDVVQNIAGDTTQVSALIPAGVDPHTFAPSPRDIAMLAEADVVFINGVNLEELVLEAIRNAGTNAPLVVASACIPILPITAASSIEITSTTEPGAATEEIDPALAQQCDSHQGEIDRFNTASGMAEFAAAGKVQPYGALYSITCDTHAETGGDTHETGCDPHVWTNPKNVIYWSLMIRDTLIDLDPDNAQVYTDQAAAYITQIEQLTHDLIIPALISIPESSRILVTNHDTLGYFANAFDFTIVGTVIPGISTTNEPSAAAIAALIDTIKHENVKAVFAENTINTRIAEQVAAEGGAQFYDLLTDSLNASGETGTTYLDYLRYNVTTIVEALGGTLPAESN